MTLPDDYLAYPRRQRGMDHDRYGFSPAHARKKLEWPGGARTALWIVPAIEFFPLDMDGKPFRAPGAMERPYPDYWNYTLRDYGNRVGVFRVFAALDRYDLKASVAFNARAAARMPFLLNEVTRRGWEVLAHGVDMGKLHHAGLGVDAERALIAEAVTSLRKQSGQPVRGWLSPTMAESFDTPDLLAEAGISYVCDWVNDDVPHPLRTARGPLWAMPHAFEIDDIHLFLTYKHRPEDFVQQVVDHFHCLHEEGGKVMALAFHPWIVGVPHRIRALEQALEQIAGTPGVWSATGAEILAAARAQIGS